MKRNISIYLLFSLLFNLQVKGQDPISVVETFWLNLEKWSKTQNVEYRANIENICGGVKNIRVSNTIMDQLQNKYNPNSLVNKTFFLDSYLNNFQKAIKDNININFQDLKKESLRKEDIMSVDVLGEIFNDPSLVFISADIQIEGAINCKNRDLYLVRDGKITAIYDFYSTMTFCNACNFYDKKEYKKAFDLFRDLAYNSTNSIRMLAEYRMVSMEEKEQGCLHIDKRIREVEIAWYCYKNYQITGEIKLGKTKNIFKKIPYWDDNNKKDWSYFFRHVMWLNRNIISEGLLVERGNELFGFINEEGKTVIPLQYKFAYAFDKGTGLALVKNSNDKWGYINTEGKEIIPFKYDVGVDIFVSGKTFVIKDNTLILIDAKGNELRRISGYTNIVSQLYQDRVIALNGLHKGQYDVFDFKGNLIVQDCLHRRKDLKRKIDDEEYQYYKRYYDEIKRARCNMKPCVNDIQEWEIINQ